MLLASQSDVEDRLGRDLTGAEEALLPGILEESSALVEGYLGVTYADADQVPDVVRLVVSRVAARALTSPTDVPEGAESLTLSSLDFSATSRFGGGRSSLWLSKQDRMMLRPLHSGFTSMPMSSERYGT